MSIIELIKLENFTRLFLKVIFATVRYTYYRRRVRQPKKKKRSSLSEESVKTRRLINYLHTYRTFTYVCTYVRVQEKQVIFYILASLSFTSFRLTTSHFSQRRSNCTLRTISTYLPTTNLSTWRKFHFEKNYQFRATKS